MNKTFIDRGKEAISINNVSILQDLYDSCSHSSFSELEDLCKKFVSNNELDKAWTIMSIIEEN